MRVAPASRTRRAQAERTASKHDLDDRDLTLLHTRVGTAVPLSAGRYNTEIEDGAQAHVDELEAHDGVEQAEAIAPNRRLQLGSLGSGNHFIEVSLDESDAVWLFLHSGSRGVGNKLAAKHIEVAQQQCTRRWIQLPDPDLAYLVEGEPEFWAYLSALRWAQHFALLNRVEMMRRVVRELGTWLGTRVERVEEVNCHHNYTARETHLGREVWLSRKGAIDAHDGVLGLIPGSMGDRSFVVRGKGNPGSLCSPRTVRDATFHARPHGRGSPAPTSTSGWTALSGATRTPSSTSIRRHTSRSTS